MIIGNPQIFAIESEINQAFERLDLRALGFFAIHIGGRSYGIRKENATMLAIAFDGVSRRIARRGNHRVPILSNSDARELASAYSRAIYIDHPEGERFFGMVDSQFAKLLNSNSIIWAPDGEEGFDDGSCIMQFDVGEMVRLIAFSRATNPLFDSESLRELWLPKDDFYSVLHQWHKSFENEWKLLLEPNS